MEEIVYKNAIEKDSNPPVVGAAHGKLRTQVIIGRNAGQTLHRADRIADDYFGKVL